MYVITSPANCFWNNICLQPRDFQSPYLAPNKKNSGGPSGLLISVLNYICVVLYYWLLYLNIDININIEQK